MDKNIRKTISYRYTNKFFRNICISLIALFGLITIYICLFCYPSFATEINGPEIKFLNENIQVKAILELDDKYIQELKKGITKEFKFYIDIFRVWERWPDEFIFGKSITRTLKCDPVKKEYISTSNDGTKIIEKRFRSFESMINWALQIEDFTLINIKDLEPATYYIKVTVESKIRKLPPVIGYFLVFLPENEFKIKKNSTQFTIGINK